MLFKSPAPFNNIVGHPPVIKNEVWAEQDSSDRASHNVSSRCVVFMMPLFMSFFQIVQLSRRNKQPNCTSPPPSSSRTENLELQRGKYKTVFSSVLLPLEISVPLLKKFKHGIKKTGKKWVQSAAKYVWQEPQDFPDRQIYCLSIHGRQKGWKLQV